MRILTLLEQEGRAVGEALGRVALTDYIQRLLSILQDDLTAAFEARDAHCYDLAHTPAVLPEVANAGLILDDTGHTKIERAKNNFALNIFDECQNMRSHL